jgi:Mlc titration factor MtfA (ptsG expression regulator)
MFEALRRYRRNRVLRNAALPDALWRDACAALPFLAIYTTEELTRLRDLVVLFLDAKSIVGAQGHEVTPLQRTIIAIQACVLVLELDLSLYDGFENVVVYPGEFVPGVEFEDEYGIVHRRDDALAGEAMDRGPVVLSWPDVEASADWDETGMNLVIHEFAHKIDMADGDANGCPPLPDAETRRLWTHAM